jgi:hypothetical protein
LSFLNELKRCKVVRAAIACLILIGFVFALFFDWAFELTRDGLKRTDEVEAGSNTQSTGNRLRVRLSACSPNLKLHDKIRLAHDQ